MNKIRFILCFGPMVNTSDFVTGGLGSNQLDIVYFLSFCIKKKFIHKLSLNDKHLLTLFY